MLTNSLKLVPSLGFQGALSVAAVSQTTHMASVDTSGVSSLNRESPSFSENKKLNEKNAFDVFPHSNFSSSLPVGLFDPHLGPIMALLEFLFIQIDNSLIESSIANISALNNSDSLLETRNLAFDANASLPSDSLLLKLCADRINLLAPYKQHLPEVLPQLYFLY